jgi:hypothetical protein
LTTIDNRTSEDRRKKPTPALSWYTFFGRRRGFRRELDREKGGYVDSYSSKLFFFLISLIGLNILDVLFTMMILDNKGWEFNPVVRSAMDIHGDRFWIWKFGIVSICLTLLCLHSKFRHVTQIIVGLSLVYLLTILYQVFILVHL